MGFQHVCASNKKGIFTVQRITDGKRKRKKLQAIKQELRRRMHEPVAKTGAWLRSVLNGYYQYHAVPGNLRALKRFGHWVARAWRQVLRRRSDQHKPTWTQLVPIFQ
ncbi:MAG: group II intron reverse transcriptase/maturase, partial [Bryobacteraceae bacterium]